MKAPEKLYIALNEITEDGCTFVLNHRVDYPICTEYICTDAFIKKLQNKLDELYHEWFDDSTGLECSEEGSELGALNMAYESFQEIIDNLK